MFRLACILFGVTALFGADNLRFSVGVKYWPSTFETSLAAPSGDGFTDRSESGSGALGGLTLALSANKWNFALSWMDGTDDYTLIEDPDFDSYTAYSKTDVDLSVNYALHPRGGINLGYKMIDTSEDTATAGQTVIDSDVGLKGIYAGGYLTIPVESARSLVSISGGWGFLNVDDLKISYPSTSVADIRYETSNADGPTAEIAWNVLLGRWVLSLGYKYQDFKYDVTIPADPNFNQDAFTYSTKDALDGLTLGVRIFL